MHGTKNRAAAPRIKQAKKPKKEGERRSKARSCCIAVDKKASCGLPRERRPPEPLTRTAPPKTAAQWRRLRGDRGWELGLGARNPRKVEGFLEARRREGAVVSNWWWGGGGGVGWFRRGRSRDGWGKAPWKQGGPLGVGLFCNLSPCLFYFIFFLAPFLKALQHFIFCTSRRERVG